MKDQYIITDKTIALLRKKSIKRFENLRSSLRLTKFDKLNIIKSVDKLYKELDNDNKSAFFTLAKAVYNDVKPHGNEKPNKEWLLALLDESDPVTMYIYSNEVLRKRDRLEEALLTGEDNYTEIRKALSYWHSMTAQYADNITDMAVLKSFKDTGVKKVKWVTQEDEKVCGRCEPKDGNVYSIDNVPPKEHWRCRCYFVPVL